MALIDPTTPSGVMPVGDTTGQYTLVFSDEFNQSSIDSTRWVNQVDWYSPDNGILSQVNYDSNVNGNSCLRIWPPTVSTTLYNSKGSGWGGSPDRAFHTRGKFEQVGGYWESRILMPKGRSCWPAFWLYHVPTQNEIDIFEAYGNYASTGWGFIGSDGLIHPNNYAASYHRGFGVKEFDMKYPDQTGILHDYTAQFYIWGFRWDASTGRTQNYLWWHDSQGVLRGGKWGPDVTWTHQNAMFTLVNLAFGNAAASATDSDPPRGSGNSMFVDWVRAWRLGGSGVVPAPSPPAPTPPAPSPTTPPFAAAMVNYPAAGSTISGTVQFTLFGKGIQNVELLPATGYTPMYARGTIQNNGDAAYINFDTTTRPNGSFTARVAAYDKTPGSSGSTEITALPATTWTIDNTAPSPSPDPAPPPTPTPPPSSVPVAAIADFVGMANRHSLGGVVDYLAQPLPPNFANGDLLIWVITTDTEADGHTLPTGWVRLFPDQSMTADGGKVIVAKRIASAEPTSYTVVLPNTNEVCSTMLAYRVNQPRIDHVSVLANNTAQSSPWSMSETSLSGMSEKAKLVWISCVDNAIAQAPTYTPPTGFTARSTITDSAWVSHQVSDKDFSSTGGSTEAISATASGSGSAGTVSVLIGISGVTFPGQSLPPAVFPINAINKDRLIPLSFGECHNVPALLVDSAMLEYKLHSGYIERIIEVRDNGVPVNFTALPERGSFRLITSPAGVITASVQGDISDVYRNTAAKLIERLATGFGKVADRFTAADIDTDNFAEFDAAHQQPMGIYLEDRANVLEVCQQLAASVGAQVCMSRNVKLRILKVQLPPVGTSIVITPDDMVRKSLEIVERPVVTASVKLGFARNWTLQDNINTAIPDMHKKLFAQEWLTQTRVDASVASAYRLHEEPRQEDTLLLRLVDAELEAERRLNLRKVQRTVFRFTGFANMLDVELGQAVTLVHPRFGLSAGKQGIVITLSPDWLAARCTVEVLV